MSNFKSRNPGIDFAAIEASAEAFEVIDNFGAQQNVNTNTGYQHNYYDMAYSPNEIVEIQGQEMLNTYYDYVDLTPIYANHDVFDLKDGTSFTFTGYIIPNCERFSINFILNNPSKDVALHINPRLPQNYIVRNTKVNGVWGREEVASALPFTLHRGAKFSIQILLTESCYMISVNGHHFAEYAHRLPYKSVRIIEVKGDVDNIDMERIEAESYPERLSESQIKDIRLELKLPQTNEEDKENIDDIDGHIPQEWRIIRLATQKAESVSEENAGLSMPYYGRLQPKSLMVGRCIKIEGRIKLLPHSFYINLQQGQNIWPHPLIAFHFNPRFSKQSGAIGSAIVCRNAWYNGSWGREERSILDTDLRPGKTFCLSIVCSPEGFEVYVDRKFLTRFNYQLEPEIVDTIYIQGDIKLWDVFLENNKLFNGKSRLYENSSFLECDES
ncbi:galectin-8-like isoform X2 [Teleopsis dalmanni]|nr:galectin-8-like isoform X2 [Teleopsis dalmanni]